MPTANAINIESEATAIQDRIRTARFRTDYYIAILKDAQVQTADTRGDGTGAEGEIPPRFRPDLPLRI